LNGLRDWSGRLLLEVFIVIIEEITEIYDTLGARLILRVAKE